MFIELIMQAPVWSTEDSIDQNTHCLYAWVKFKNTNATIPWHVIDVCLESE